MSYILSVLEAFHSTMPGPQWGFGAAQPPTDVYKNPGHSELRKSTTKDGHVRVFLHGKDAYTFSPNHALHYNVQKHLGLDDNRMSLSVFHNHKDASIRITDDTKGTKWHHSPDAKSAILNHPWIKKTFKGNKDIDYYDEDIVGPWHKET